MTVSFNVGNDVRLYDGEWYHKGKICEIHQDGSISVDYKDFIRKYDMDYTELLECEEMYETFLLVCNETILEENYFMNPDHTIAN